MGNPLLVSNAIKSKVESDFPGVTVDVQESGVDMVFKSPGNTKINCCSFTVNGGDVDESWENVEYMIKTMIGTKTGNA